MTERTPHLELELSAYLDDELDATARRAVETHVNGCVECAAALEGLRAVVAGARVLEDRPPEADLWPGIAARMGVGSDAAATPAIVRLPRMRSIARRFSFSLPQLAAAGLVVALLSSGAAWWLTRVTNPDRDRATTPAPAGRADVSDADFDTRSYDQAVIDLRQVLDENRGRLDPETVRAVESNLATIDGAILQARRALLADPSNPYLSGHLAEQMKRKIRVLQQTANAATADYGGAS